MKPLKNIPNPHLLTPKALMIAQGKYCINIQEEDWQSLYRYWEREDIVNAIVAGLTEQFTNHKK